LGRGLFTFLLTFVLFSVKISAQPECWPVDYTVETASSIPAIVRPVCDGFSFTAAITNVNTACAVTYQIDLRFFTSENTSFQSLEEIFNDMIYTGGVPVFSTSTGNVGGVLFFDMAFRVTIPAEGTRTIVLPFSTTAINFTPFGGWTTQLFVNSIEDDGELSYPLFDDATLFMTRLIDWDQRAFGISGDTDISDVLATYPSLGGADLIIFPATGTTSPPTLTIDEPFSPGTFNSLSRIFLSPGATIKVVDGGSLNLIALTVLASPCSTQLAQGIIVEPGGELKVTNCTLSEARFAIDAQPGSTISVTGTAFSDNFIGLNLNMGAAPEANKRVNLLALSGNSFATVSPAIKSPFTGMTETVESRGYCGIWLNDYRDFNVFGATNTFEALANGIIARRSTLNLGNMSFDDMNSADDPSTYPLQGFGIHLDGRGNRPYWAHINEMWHTMTFNNCVTGIMGIHYSAQVDNVDMTNVTTGIDWSRSQTGEVRLRNNDISARRFGVRSFLNEPLAANSTMSANNITITTAGGGLMPVTGIEMQETGAMGANFIGGWNVTGNDVTMNAGGRGILYRNGMLGIIDGNSIINESVPGNYTGIFTESNLLSNVSRNTITQNSSIGLGAANGIFSAAGAANTYQCNCIDNTHIGAQFLDMADFTNAVRGNNFNTHTTGLRIGSPGVGQAFIGIQNRTGNLWDLGEIPTGEFGGVNWGADQFIISKSRFLVPGAMGSNVEHPDVDPPTGWFIQDTEGSSFSCATACSFPTSGGVPPRVAETGVPTDMDYAIVNGTLSDNEDMAWKGEYRLYRKLLRQPAMEQYDTEFAAFKTAQATLPAGILAYIAEERVKLYALDSLDQITDADYRSDIATQTESLRVLDSLKQAEVSIDTAAYNALVAQKAADELDYATFLQELDSLRQLQIAALLSLNAGVSTATVCVTNHTLVNNILLNLLATGAEAPSSTDLDILAAIAEMCPIEGGDAVYEARAIVERLTGETYDDVVLCAVEERPSKGRESDAQVEQKAVVVFPNPSTGLLQWSGTTGEMVTVRVFDQLGVLLKEQNLNGTQIDMGLLPNGLYFVQITGTDGVVLTTQKVSLLKH